MISVIIPLFNSEQTIAECINSVFNQDYRGDIEIIVVNDGSTDNSMAVVKGLALSSPLNINLKWISKVNEGAASARNVGIAESSGDLIAFLDSDDEWSSSKLSEQVCLLSHNLHIRILGSNRNSEIYPFFNKSVSCLFSLRAFEILFKWYPQTSTIIVRRDLLDCIGFFNANLTHAEDGDFLLRAAQLTSVWVLNKSLVITGRGKRSYGVSGLSADIQKMFRGEMYNLSRALERRQVTLLESCVLFLWMSSKYIRRILVTQCSS